MLFHRCGWRSNKQSRNTWSAWGRGRPHHRRAVFHRVRQVLAPFASSACAHLLLPNCAVWPPWSDCPPSSAVVSVVVELRWEVLGKLCGRFLAQALARCPAQVLQPIRCCFHRNIPNWTTCFHHTKSRHGEAHCTKPAFKTLTPCYHVLAKNELVCEPLVDTTFENLGEHEWRNGVQKNECESECDKRKVLFYLCGRVAHLDCHRRGPNPQCCKQHGTEHEHPLD